MRFAKSNRRHIVKPEMTAMIDVIFLIVIFFMATAQFVVRARADLELPLEQGEDEQQVDVPPMVINVLHTGRAPFVIGERELDMVGVLSVIDLELVRLRKEGLDARDFELTIRADRRGISGVINELGRELRERGITHWRLAVEKSR